MNDSSDASGPPSISTASSETYAAQSGIDLLFERSQEKSSWEPARPPQVLGELLDSRHMLPLLFPSDPRMLAALPGRLPFSDEKPPLSAQLPADSRSASRASSGSRGSMPWRLRNRKLREVGVKTLQWVDGIHSAARWARLAEHADDEQQPPSYASDTLEEGLTLETHITPLTRKPSGRSKGRPSQGGETTPVERP